MLCPVLLDARRVRCSCTATRHARGLLQQHAHKASLHSGRNNARLRSGCNNALLRSACGGNLHAHWCVMDRAVKPPRPARFSMSRAQPCILITKPTATARMDANKRALHACEECFRRLLPPLQNTRQRCGSPTAAVTQHHPQHQHQQLWVAVLQLPKAGREGARHALSGLRQPELGCATIDQNAASTVAHRGVTKQCGEQRMG